MAKRTKTLAAPAGPILSPARTRVIYCGDNLDTNPKRQRGIAASALADASGLCQQLKKLPGGSVDLITMDPPFHSNRNDEVFWGETKEKRAFQDRHESTKATIEFMRPRAVELARVLKKTGSFYYHCDWNACHYAEGRAPGPTSQWALVKTLDFQSCPLQDSLASSCVFYGRPTLLNRIDTCGTFHLPLANPHLGSFAGRQ